MFRPASPTTRRRGFYLIGVLIVLAIILVLYGKQLAGDKSEGISSAQTKIDRSKEVACSVNRQMIVTGMTAWQISHPGEQPTIEGLRSAGVTVPNCPQGGTYSIGPKGDVWCSIHNPPPGATPEP